MSGGSDNVAEAHTDAGVIARLEREKATHRQLLSASEGRTLERAREFIESFLAPLRKHEDEDKRKKRTHKD